MSDGFAMDQLFMASPSLPDSFSPSSGRGSGGASDEGFATILDTAVEHNLNAQRQTDVRQDVSRDVSRNHSLQEKDAALVDAAEDVDDATKQDSEVRETLLELLQSLLFSSLNFLEEIAAADNPDESMQLLDKEMQNLGELLEKMELLKEALPLFSEEQLEQLQTLLEDADGDWAEFKEELALFFKEAEMKNEAGEKVELFDKKLDKEFNKGLDKGLDKEALRKAPTEQAAMKEKIASLKEAQAAKEEKIAALKEARQLKQDGRIANLEKELGLTEEELKQKLQTLKETHEANQKKLNQLLEKLRLETQNARETGWRLSAEAKEKLSQESTTQNMENRNALREVFAQARRAGETLAEDSQKAMENGRVRQQLQQAFRAAGEESSSGGDKFSRVSEMMRQLSTTATTGEQQILSADGKAQDAMLSRAEMRTVQQQQPLQESILNQLKGRLAYFKGTESFPAEMRMTLRPPAMGEVLVRVFQQKDRLTAAIIAERASVKELLDGNLNDLKQRFQQMNLNVERVEVYNSADEFAGSDFQREFLFQDEQQEGYGPWQDLAPESPSNGEIPAEDGEMEEKEPGSIDLRA